MPAMTFIEMSLLREAIANAFGIVLLIAVCVWLLHRAVQRSRQLWRHHKLSRAFEESKDHSLLLRRSLQSLAETPGIQMIRKPSR